MSLDNAIKEAIKKNLPEQTAEELRRYIEETTSLKDNLKHVQKQYSELDKNYEIRGNEISELRKQLLKYQDIENREKTVLAQEKHIALTELSEVKEKEKVMLMKELCSAVFRNKLLMHQTTTSGNEAPYPGGFFNKNNSLFWMYPLH